MSPVSSSYVMPLLRQTPTLVRSPFAIISAMWSQCSSLDSTVASRVPAAERQALNAMLSTDWLDVSPCFTAAHWAATFGFLDVLQYCESVDKASLLRKDQMGNLPLHWAAKGGNVGTMKLIVDLSRSNAQQNHHNSGNILHTLGEHGMNVAFMATVFDHAPVLEYLSQEGVLHDLITHDPITPQAARRHQHDRNPSSRKFVVHTAASCGALRCIALLRSKDTDIFVKDNRRRTITHYAAENGALNILEYLHRTCPKEVLCEPDDSGGSGLHYAARGSKPHAVPFFHEVVRIPIAAVDFAGRSAAMWCVMGGKSGKHITTLKYMHEKGFPLLEETQSLMKACQGSHGVLCQLYQFLRSQEQLRC